MGALVGKTVCMVGARGKMGIAIKDAFLLSDSGVSGIVDVDPFLGTEAYHKIEEVDLADHKDGIHLVINFTNPKATLESARWCMTHKIPLICGTTGLSARDQEELGRIAHIIPVLWAPNMSLGVNLIDALLPQLKPLKEFDIEIVEAHHRLKKDSPSGTAMRWAKTLASAFGRKVVNSRPEGVSQGRDKEDIYVHAMRGGTVPGEHTVYFFGPDEVIEITHRAASRLIFAKGAVMAAKWIIGQPPGFYSMKEVLGL